MKNKPYNVNVHKESWHEIRNMLGGNRISDTKRTIVLKEILKSVDLKNKLNPELTDSENDKVVKNILRRIL